MNQTKGQQKGPNFRRCARSEEMKGFNSRDLKTTSKSETRLSRVLVKDGAKSSHNPQNSNSISNGAESEVSPRPSILDDSTKQVQSSPKAPLTQRQGSAIIGLLVLISLLLVLHWFLALRPQTTQISKEFGFASPTSTDSSQTPDAKRANQSHEPSNFNPKLVKLIEASVKKLLIQLFKNEAKKVIEEIVKKELKGVKRRLSGLEKQIRNLKDSGGGNGGRPSLECETPALTLKTNEWVFSMNLKRELIANNGANAHIGVGETRVAIKNKDSYLMASYGKGFVLFENGEKVDEGSFSGTNQLYDTVYVRQSDSYYLLIGGVIYKKQINGLSPEVWINDGIGFGYDAPFVYSEKLERIVTQKGKNIFAIIDPNQKEVEFELPFTFADYIVSLKFFGENDEYILFATWNRYVGVLKYDKGSKQGEIIAKVHYPGHHFEKAHSVDIDSRNRVIMVSTLDRRNARTQNLYAFEFWNNVLTLKDSLDISDISRYIGANGLRFFKSYQNYAVFVAVDTGTSGGFLNIFRYDYYRKVIVRDTEKTISALESYIKNLRYHEGWFYYTGIGGKLMRIALFSGKNEEL